MDTRGSFLGHCAWNKLCIDNNWMLGGSSDRSSGSKKEDKVEGQKDEGRRNQVGSQSADGAGRADSRIGLA